MPGTTAIVITGASTRRPRDMSCTRATTRLESSRSIACGCRSTRRSSDSRSSRASCVSRTAYDSGRPRRATEVRHLADDFARAQLRDDARRVVGPGDEHGHATAHQEVDGIPDVALPEQDLAPIQRHRLERGPDLGEECRIDSIEGRALCIAVDEPLALEVRAQLLVQPQRRGGVVAGKALERVRRDDGDRGRAPEARSVAGAVHCAPGCASPASCPGPISAMCRSTPRRSAAEATSVPESTTAEVRDDIVLPHHDLAVRERVRRGIVCEQLQAGVGHVREQRQPAEDVRSASWPGGPDLVRGHRRRACAARCATTTEGSR